MRIHPFLPNATPRAPTGWATRREQSFGVLRAAFGTLLCCLQKPGMKLDRAEQLMGLLTHTRNPAVRPLYVQRCLPKCVAWILHVLLPDKAWRQAQTSIRKGGLGIRDPTFRASAAFHAGTTSFLCRNLWPDLETVRGSRSTLPTRRSSSQMQLDASTARPMLRVTSPTSCCETHHQADRISFQLCHVAGAGAWLVAGSTALCLAGTQTCSVLLSAIAVVSPSRRQTQDVPAVDSSSIATATTQYADGGSVRRHNYVAQVFCEAAQEAGLCSQKENGGLLQLRLPAGSPNVPPWTLPPTFGSLEGLGLRCHFLPAPSLPRSRTH